MTKYLDCRVVPDTKHRLTEREKSEVFELSRSGLGCLSIIIICVSFLPIFFGIAILGDMYVTEDTKLYAWLDTMTKQRRELFIGISMLIISAILSIAPVALFKGFVFLIKYKIELHKFERKKVSAIVNEAARITSHAVALYKSSSDSFLSLPELLKRASESLDQAHSEYKHNAFGPFWDKVENAAGYLAAFNSKVAQLAQNADDYYASLKGRNHNFSSFPVRHESLPNPSSVIEEFNLLVRRGQTNFQFATIWEHRKTREALIAGFRTLGEAVNNLGVVIDNSISDLKSSISSDIAGLVEEQIMTRETIAEHAREQSSMLDNIQRRRKPL